jgi:hypothetical protein
MQECAGGGIDATFDPVNEWQPHTFNTRDLHYCTDISIERLFNVDLNALNKQKGLILRRRQNKYQLLTPSALFLDRQQARACAFVATCAARGNEPKSRQESWHLFTNGSQIPSSFQAIGQQKVVLRHASDRTPRVQVENGQNSVQCPRRCVRLLA